MLHGIERPNLRGTSLEHTRKATQTLQRHLHRLGLGSIIFVLLDATTLDKVIMTLVLRMMPELELVMMYMTNPNSFRIVNTRVGKAVKFD